jgi:hypothetical protein
MVVASHLQSSHLILEFSLKFRQKVFHDGRKFSGSIFLLKKRFFNEPAISIRVKGRIPWISE